MHNGMRKNDDAAEKNVLSSIFTTEVMFPFMRSNNISRIPVNIVRRLKSTLNIDSGRRSVTYPIEVDVKDMSVHGLCLDSLKTFVLGLFKKHGPIPTQALGR
jgi:hypothetical protein